MDYRELTGDENRLLTEEQKRDLRAFTVKQKRADVLWHRMTVDIVDSDGRKVEVQDLMAG